MTHKATKKRNKQRKKQRVLPDLGTLLGSLCQRGIAGVLLVSVAIVTLLGLTGLSSSGFLVDWWSRTLLQGFGWASYVIVVVVAGVGGFTLAGKTPDLKRVPWHIVVGAGIVILSLLGLTHLFTAGPDPWRSAQAGEAGGYVGAVFSGTMRELLGPVPAGVVLVAVLAWGAIVASGVAFEEWVERTENWGYRAWRRLAAAPIDVSPRQPAVKVEAPAESVARDTGGERPESAPQANAAPPVASRSPSEPLPRPKRARRRRSALPPLRLLDLPSGVPFDEADIQRKAQVIEQTLSQFGVPAKVVEINRGPMVTQFGVEPGYVTRRGYDGAQTERKIRVGKIASLSKDLALALAASPVRIEAPVPGRSMVGIEVPNRQVSTVPLRKIMTTPAFRRHRSRMKLALGEGIAGAPTVADLAKMPHLLIAGATGAGKSVCVNAIATCLLFQNSPFTLRMVMIDPKRVELARYRGLPHLYGQVEVDTERIVGVLRWLVREMQERYKKLAQAGARHLDDYNRHWRIGGQEYLPRIVVLIDELADLMLSAPDQVETAICRLAQMARATGMHLVIATQRPSVDVVTGLIKANFPARIGFAVSSGVDSRVILDTVGAETLLSKGDMLYMAPDASGLVRAQGCLVSDTELARVVRYWQEWATAKRWKRGPPPWGAILDQENEARGDDLLQRAIEIVRQQGSASASMLQRRMRVGYPRASRLIDEMEEREIVGPAESGGRPRQVLGPVQDEPGQ